MSRPLLILLASLAAAWMVSACTLSYGPSHAPLTPLTAAATLDTAHDLATIPPSTPLPTLTPSPTLLPPPTFEPPTLTPWPSPTPSLTPPPTLNLNVEISGLHGLETPTATATHACAPRDDWRGTYTVQPNDYLFNLAQRYQVSVADMAAANCLHNISILSVGQELKVPGDGGPAATPVVCSPWEPLTPMDGAMGIAGAGQLIFNWRGPRAERNLIRVFAPDGKLHEWVVDLRQNETIDLADLPEGGRYQWQVYPLDFNFYQLPCQESPRWTFTKGSKE